MRQPAPICGTGVKRCHRPPAPSEDGLQLGHGRAFVGRALGSYIGIRSGGQLVAMAGERMKFDGFTEISAVCSHPEHRGR
ncbi:MAG: hypothetical protein WBW06_03770, partial [Xanthobacteraceae bacterium]